MKHQESCDGLLVCTYDWKRCGCEFEPWVMLNNSFYSIFVFYLILGWNFIRERRLEHWEGHFRVADKGEFW